MIKISEIIILFFFVMLISCSKDSEKREVSSQKDSSKAAIEYFTCPMHPQIVQDHFGTCPICKMDLVKKIKQPKEEPKTEEYYTCPMHPQIIRKEFGLCPICNMDLIKKTKTVEHGSKSLSEVSLSPSQLAIMNIGTTLAEEKEFFEEITSYGILEYSEKKQYIISSRFSGRIEKLFVDNTGMNVKKHDPLFEVYSPDIITAEEEYLHVLNSNQQDGNNNKLKEAIRNRLIQWGIIQSQIDELEKNNKVNSKIIIFSPYSGIVTKKNIFEGQYVSEGIDLFSLSDLSSLWIKARFNENDISKISVGKKLSIFSDLFPEMKISGIIDFIYPEIDLATRSLLVRTEVQNPANKLKPGMYVTLSVRSSMSKGLIIPATAVFDNGDEKIVWVQKSEGTFVPTVVNITRKVKISNSKESYYHITNGISSGENIVTSGGFLIDSESRIKAQANN